jgi:hypothetical protein
MEVVYHVILVLCFIHKMVIILLVVLLELLKKIQIVYNIILIHIVSDVDHNFIYQKESAIRLIVYARHSKFMEVNVNHAMMDMNSIASNVYH